MDEEKYYIEVERPKVLQSIKEWCLEFPEEYRRKLRGEYLENLLQESKKAFFDACEEWAARTDDKTVAYWSIKHLEMLEHNLRKVGMEIKIHLGKAEGISPEKIVAARNYPLATLIQHRNYMARCPFHNDKSPSLDLRKNFYHCYGCGANGDVIDFIQKTRDVSFKQAVDILAP